MSVEQRHPGPALIAEVCSDGEVFVSLLLLNVAVDFSFLLSEVTCELTLRADPSSRQVAKRWW